MLLLAGLAAVTCSEVNSDDVPDCSRSFCGCWEDAILEFSTKILDKHYKPLPDIEVFCAGEETPRAVSDQSGVAALTVSTQRSPGCHYAVCSNLIFRDKRLIYAERQFTVYQANGQTIHLNRIK